MTSGREASAVRPSLWCGLLMTTVLFASSLAFAPRAEAVEPGEDSFLAASGNVVHFVRWTSDGASLLGSITAFTPSTYEWSAEKRSSSISRASPRATR